MSNVASILTIVAAPDSVLRSSIVSFLGAIPAVRIMALTDQTDGLAGLVCQLNADTLVLDADLCPADSEAVLSRVLACRPGLNTIVHASSRPQLDRLRAAGACHTLLKGFRSDHLRQAVLDRCSPVMNDTPPASGVA